MRCRGQGKQAALPNDVGGDAKGDEVRNVAGDVDVGRLTSNCPVDVLPSASVTSGSSVGVIGEEGHPDPDRRRIVRRRISGGGVSADRLPRRSGRPTKPMRNQLADRLKSRSCRGCASSHTSRGLARCPDSLSETVLVVSAEFGVLHLV